MSWGPPLYAQCADRAHALSLGRALGMAMPEDGSLPTGDRNFAMREMPAPWATAPALDAAGEVVAPGILEPGFWLMGRLNDAFEGKAVILRQLADARVLRALADPPMVWAGEDG